MSPQIDAIQMLGSLGASETPPLTATAVDRIESELLVAGTGNGNAARSSPPGAFRPRGCRPVGSALAIAAAAAVLVALLISDPGMPELKLAGATQVGLERPDGSREVGAAGVELPDVTVITLGPGGFAQIGGTRLLAGDVAEVRNGQLVIRESRPTADEADGPTAPGPQSTIPGDPTPADVSLSPRPGRQPPVDPHVRSRQPTTTGFQRAETTTASTAPQQVRGRVEFEPRSPLRQPAQAPPTAAPPATANTSAPLSPRTSTTTTGREPTR